MPLPDRPIACGAALRAAVFAAAAATASCATQTGPYDPLASLFAAERAFAQQSVREGMRAAFAANFAADGVVLWPAPVRLHDALAAQPAPADPKSFTLDW